MEGFTVHLQDTAVLPALVGPAKVLVGQPNWFKSTACPAPAPCGPLLPLTTLCALPVDTNPVIAWLDRYLISVLLLKTSGSKLLSQLAFPV